MALMHTGKVLIYGHTYGAYHPVISVVNTSYPYIGNTAAYLFDAEKFEASSGDSGLGAHAGHDALPVLSHPQACTSPGSWQAIGS